MTFQINCLNPEPLQAPDKTEYLGKKGVDPNYVISRDKDGRALSRFKDQKWDLRVYGAKQTFNFENWWDAKSEGPMDALALKLTNEIKTLFWLSMFETTANAGHPRGLGHLYQIQTILRAIAKMAYSLKIALTEADGSAQFQVTLRSSIANVAQGFTPLTPLMALLQDVAFWHQLKTIECDVARIVPEAELTQVLRIIQKKAQTRRDKFEHYPLIPTRLLGKIIGGAKEQLKNAEPYLLRLEAFIKAVNADPNLFLSRKRSYANNLKRVKKIYPDYSIQTLNETKVQRLSEFKTLELFGLAIYAEQVGLNNIKSIYSHVSHLQVLCIFLIHAFSGMRKSEVQVMPFDPIVHTEAKGFGSLPVLVSHLEKFTQRGNYSRPLAWATSEEGLYAVSIAQQLCRIKWFRNHPSAEALPSNIPLFIGNELQSAAPNIHYALPVATTPFQTTLWREACKSLELKIEAEDLEELREFDAFRAWDDDPNFALGKIWPLTSHQFRRSVAVYASRSGMVSLPTLKTQFKHLSEVMTALYSENSSFAQNFLIDENGKPKDEGSILMTFRDAVAFNTSLRFHEQVIQSENRLNGPVGKQIQRAKENNTLKNIFLNKEETQKAVKQGRFSYKETPVGGCVLKNSCPHFAIDLVLPCTSGCEHAILKPEKLETYIESLRFDMKTLSPKSHLHQLIAKEIDFVTSTYLKKSDA